MKASWGGEAEKAPWVLRQKQIGECNQWWATMGLLLKKQLQVISLL